MPGLGDTMKKPRYWKRALTFVLGVICAVPAIAIRPAETKADDFWPDGPDIDTPSAIVMEVNTGTILYEKNSQEQHYPASITKILTTLLALENSSLDEVVTFSHDAVYLNEGDTSHIYRDVGEEMTMEQCLYAVMLASANECAYAVAEHVGESLGGDYRTFIDLMNERATELGAVNTHFNNSNGLPDTEHWTCAYDMALISCEAYKNENFRIITGTETYTIPYTNKHPDEVTYLTNHHKMLHYYKTSEYIYPYCTGGKTGYTNAAGSTLVTYAEKDGMTLVCVVMNTKTPKQWTDTRTLLDYCFDNFQTLNISENETSITETSEKDLGILNTNEPFVTLDTDAYIVLPKTSSFEDAQVVLSTGQDEETLATFEYSYANRTVGQVSIVTTGAEVETPEFKEPVPDTEEGEEVKVVRVDPRWIGIALLGVAVLVGLIFFLHWYFQNYYIRKHDRAIRKEQKERFRQIKRRREFHRGRRGRMFK
jgi:D-alanyl-D-alanine carboxypeptidase